MLVEEIKIDEFQEFTMLDIHAFGLDLINHLSEYNIDRRILEGATPKTTFMVNLINEEKPLMTGTLSYLVGELNKLSKSIGWDKVEKMLSTGVFTINQYK